MKRMWKKLFILLITICLFSFLVILNYQSISLTERENRSLGSNAGISKRFNIGMLMEGKHMKERPATSDHHVYIVEEHHAVLKYWFDAVKQGLLSPKDNTLVHIDGHSDLAMPFNTAFFPAFRIPQTIYDLEAMMQSNDVFIMGATLSGLFKKVIWIWPSWDKSEHEQIEDIEVFKLGVTTLAIDDPEEFGHTFCMCFRNSTLSRETCVYTPVKAERDDLVQIPPAFCDIHTELNVLSLNELTAVETLKETVGNEMVLLDIDEDYYGCTLPAQDLVDVGMKMTDIENLNEILEGLICPRTTDKELKSDKVLYDILEILKSEQACRNVASFSSCTGVSRRKIALDYLKHKIVEFRLGCPRNGNKFLLLLRKLISRLSVLTITQLTVLQSVGFCLSTMMPDSSMWESSFGICHGNNVPGNTAVFNHATNASEVVYRTGLLQNILKTLNPERVQITTVCRSVRDGYTPRKYFPLIEKSVLNSLSVLGKHNLFSYDPWLLGGKQGWNNRYKNH